MSIRSPHLPPALTLCALVAAAALPACRGRQASASSQPRAAPPPRAPIDARAVGAAPLTRAAQPPPRRAPAPAPAWTETFVLDSAPHPSNDHPSVLVHAPAGFDPTRRPLDVVVFLHGWSECIAAVVSPTDVPCTPGAARSSGLDVLRAFDRGGVDALLVVPQLVFDQPLGDPGRWVQPGRFATFLRDAVARALALHGGGAAPPAFRRVVLAGHSAAYQTVAAVLDAGGVDAIREVYLLDCAYNIPYATDAWARARAARFVPGDRDGPRLVLLYTEHRLAVPRSRAFAARITALIPRARRAEAALVDDSLTPVGDAIYRAPFVVRRVGARHHLVPSVYLPGLLRTSGLRQLERPAG